MAIAAKKKVDSIKIVKDWQREVTDVVDQVATWTESHPSKPSVRRTTTTISEPELGVYDVPDLDVVFNGEFKEAITVEPIARNYPGRGHIDIIGWPTLRRVYLTPSASKSWEVYTASNIPLH